jgi:GNAT superfamily N-acetyltransferase
LPRFSDPERLSSDHVLSGFDCGVPSLNYWLEKHARTAAAVGSARTFVIADSEQGGRVVGYYSLAVASITHEEAIERAAKGMPRHEIPAVLLARLAVDESVKGAGLGAFMLRDAMTRALAVGEEAAVRLMLVHAVNDGARSFYKHFGFESSSSDPMNMQLLLKDMRASLDAAAGMRSKAASP